MPEQVPPPQATTKKEMFAQVLAAIGLCVTGYLSWLSLTGRAAPGCSGSGGCGEVLGSRWSGIGPIPVSTLAASCYLVICAILFSKTKLGGWTGIILGVFGVTLIGAATWFIALQAIAIDAWCPYCMVGHIVGLTLGILLLSRGPRKQLPKPLAGGAAMVLVLIAMQFAFPASSKRLELPTDRDFDIVRDDGRHLGLINGKLHLRVADELHSGPASGADVLVVVMDYCCPHCRNAHEMLNQQLEERSDLVVLWLPVTLHASRNPHLPIDNPRFTNSYDFALLSLAVWRDAPDQWEAFNSWLFGLEGTTGGDVAWPRTLEAAQDRAAEIIGRDTVGQLHDDPELTARVDRNIETIADVLSLAPQAVPGLPLAVSPFARGAIYGRFDEENLLDAILDDARQGRP